MHIRLRWCRRVAICRGCQKPIAAGTPEVFGVLWRRKYRTRYYWHPQCWFEEEMAYLQLHPYEKPVGSAGRPKLNITAERMRQRNLLRYRRGRALQRIRDLGKRLPATSPVIERLHLKIEEIAVEMEKVGGVPKGWRL